MLNKNVRKQQRKRRVRAKITGTNDRPRVSFYKSNQNIYIQLIDDEKGLTLAHAFGRKSEGEKLGEELAKKAVAKKVKKVVFDRGGFKFHGAVKKVAESARKGGLEF